MSDSTETNARRRFAPRPELVDGRKNARPFKTVGTQLNDGAPGQTDKRANVVASPHNIDGIATRRHELGHVAWSPVAPPVNDDAHPGLVQALEDVRINLRLRHAGAPIDDVETPRPGRPGNATKREPTMIRYLLHHVLYHRWQARKPRLRCAWCGDLIQNIERGDR